MTPEILHMLFKPLTYVEIVDAAGSWVYRRVAHQAMISAAVGGRAVETP